MMGIFPWKKKNSIEGQPVDGIVQGGEKTVLSLREKVWKFEIHPKEILTYIRNRPRKVFSITIAIVFVVGSFIYLRTSASESYFYATSCLGGWEHPEHSPAIYQANLILEEVYLLPLLQNLLFLELHYLDFRNEADQLDNTEAL
jgi:hypothetical protein